MMVAARLRGIKLGYTNRHSPLSNSLVADYIDTENMLRVTGADFIAQAAVMAHPDIDVSKANAILDKLYYNMLGSLEYPTQGRTGDELVEDERMAAVRQFQEMRKRMLKEQKPEDEQKKEPELVIKNIG